jgi:predicted DNA binding protein
MRYVRLRVTPVEGAAFHPLGDELRRDPAVQRERIHRVDLLADGTGVLLAEASGDRERYEAIIEDSAYVHEFAVSGAEGRWYSYTHFDPTETTRAMMERRRANELVLEFPVSVAEDGSMEVTLLGSQEAFENASATAYDGWDAEILEIGDKPPTLSNLYASLTSRQQEVLEAAVELGYYESPRAATQADVAEAVETTPSTVGEHLQKVEARVFQAVLE